MRNVPYSIFFLIVFVTSCSNNDKTKAESPYFTKIREERKAKNQFIVANGIIDEAYINGFDGLKYFDPDTGYRVIARLEFGPKTLRQIKTNTDELRNYYRFCTLHFKLHGADYTLNAFVEDSNKVNSLFVPFKDRSNGKTTYNSGRFLEVPYQGETDKITIDFNEAYNPYCHYSHDYSCPLVPFENTLATSVDAGEKIMHE